MLKSLFNKVVGLKASNFIKKIIQQRRFSVYLAKILRILFSTEHLAGCFCLLKWSFICYYISCTTVASGLFRGCSRVGEGKKAPQPEEDQKNI